MKLQFMKSEASQTFDVLNRDDEPLGIIEYHRPWKCWIWEQRDCCIMSASCLAQVMEKLRALDEIGPPPRKPARRIYG